MEPIITVIIPTFNSEATILRAIDSVLVQPSAAVELLVVDGGSSDLTLQLVGSYDDKRVRCISGKDKGVYDAMNKGIRNASGKWLIFLGSDDRLKDDQVLVELKEVLGKTKADVVYGDVEIDGDVSWAKGKRRYGGKFNLYMLLRRNICHQAIFYRRDFLLQHGLEYDLTYPVSADWDMNLRCWFTGKFKYVDRVISIFQGGGISSAHDDHYHLEVKKRFSELFHAPYKNKFIRTLYTFFRSISNQPS